MSDLKPPSQTTGGPLPSRTSTAIGARASWPTVTLCGMVNSSSTALNATRSAWTILLRRLLHPVSFSSRPGGGTAFPSSHVHPLAGPDHPADHPRTRGRRRRAHRRRRRRGPGACRRAGPRGDGGRAARRRAPGQGRRLDPVPGGDEEPVLHARSTCAGSPASATTSGSPWSMPARGRRPGWAWAPRAPSTSPS